MKNLKRFILFPLLCFIIFGCDNVANPQKTQNPNKPITQKQQTGFFVDAPVEGLSYKTSSGLTGVTSETGAYKYLTGDKVIFLVGNAQLGKEVEASPVITPCYLTGAAKIDEATEDGDATPEAKEALNIVKFLLSLDADDSDFGIKIPEELNTESLTTESLDLLLKSEDFAEDALEVIKTLTGDEKEIPTDEEAKEHYEIIAGQIDGEKDIDLHAKLVGDVQLRIKYDKNPAVVVGMLLPEGIDYISAFISSDKVSMGSGFRNYFEKTATDVFKYKTDDDFGLLAGDYNLQIIAFQDSTRMSVGDLYCFYNGTSFQSEYIDNKPINIDGTSPKIIYVDFTSKKHTAKVTKVYKVSGTITVDNILDYYIEKGETVDTRNIFFTGLRDIYGNCMSIKPVIKEVSRTDDIITYEYETYISPEVTGIEFTYSPFKDDRPQWYSEKQITPSENAILDFDIDCVLK